MDIHGGGGGRENRSVFGSWGSLLRKWMFRVLSVLGHVPNHIAFILDGNRRYAKKWKLEEGGGHEAGFLALLTIIKYCYELRVKYITIFAFSIDNFRRRPHEVQYVMDLMHEKIQGLLKEQSIVNQYGVRVFFVGNLKLLHEPVRIAAEKVMAATAQNTDTVLLICVAYSSSHEMVHSVEESCKRKWNEGFRGDDEKLIQEGSIVKVLDLEKHMYMGLAPDPDILIRTSGETRLSNFLLWQATHCLLYSPAALWPEIGLRHILWAVLNFQRNHSYLEKKKKQS